MKCKKCNEENLDSAKFCKKCGGDLSQVKNQLSQNGIQPATAGETKKWAYLAVGIVAGILLVTGVVFAKQVWFATHQTTVSQIQTITPTPTPQEPTSDQSLATPVQQKKTAVFFYADWCPHCQKVEAYFTQQGFFDKYDIQKLNFDDPANKELLNEIFTAQGKTDSVGIPAVIIDNQLLVGDQSIIGEFQKTIDQSNGTTQDYIDSVK